MEVTGKQITTQKTVVLLGCPGFSPTWKDQARCRFRRVENGVSSILIHGTPRGIEAQDCPRVLPYAMKLSLVQSTSVSKCSLNGRLWIISISSCRVISMSFLVLFGGSGQGNSWRYKDGPHLFLDTDEPPCCEDTLICVCVCVCVCLCVLSCSVVPDFCIPMDCSPLGSSVHGIFQARILKHIAISSSSESSQPRDQTHNSCIGKFFTTEPPEKPQTLLHHSIIKLRFARNLLPL